MNNNTSIIQDEVLAARLGLVPFTGGREGLLDFMKWFKKPEEGQEREPGHDLYVYDTVQWQISNHGPHTVTRSIWN